MPIRETILHDVTMRPKLRTAMDPLALVAGEWQNFNNIRSADNAIRARFGTSTLGAIVTSATFRGAYVCPFYGTETIFVATYIAPSSKVRVYKSTDAVTWTEITKQFNGTAYDTTIGPYGLTRMDDDGLVWFAHVQDRDVKAVTYPNTSYQQDVLVFGNQSSYPRAYGRFYGGNADRSTYPTIDTSYTAIIEPIDPPTEVQNKAVFARPFTVASGFAIRSAADMDYHNSGVNFAFSESGGTTNNHMLLTAGTSAAVGDTAIIECTLGARQLLAGVQLHIGVETTWTEFLAKCSIEVGNYSGSFSTGATIWEPSSPSGSVVTTTLGTNKYLLSFDTAALVSSSTYDAIRFTFKGGAPSSSQTVKVWMVVPGADPDYANPGNTLWAISYFNVGSHTESPGVVYTNITYPVRIETPGGNEVPDDYTGLAIPANSEVQYSYRLPLPNPTQAEIDKGIEAIRIYRQRPEDGDLFLIESYKVATYSEPDTDPGPGVTLTPTWSFTNSTSASEIRSVNGLSRAPISATTPPGDFHVPAPKARCGIGISDRMLVGAKVSGIPSLMGSELDQCFRFREISDLDSNGNYVPSSPFALNLQGDTINGFAQVAGAAVGTLPSDNIGTATVYIFGERYVYITGGKTTAQLVQVSNMGIPGCVAPGSIAVGRDTVFYLDREGQIRRIQGGRSVPISYNKVDNITKAIPSAMKRYAWGVYWGERYYLCYTPSGGTENNRILVWCDAIVDRESGQVGDWESIDIPPKTTEGLVAWFDLSTDTSKLIAFMQNVGASTTLTSYRYESGASDVGGTNNIAVAGSSYEMHDRSWNMFYVHRIGVVSDQATGKSLSFTVTYKPNGTTRSSTISVADASNSYIRRFDGVPTLSGEQMGGSATLSFSGSLPGGHRILELKAELEALDKPFVVT